MKIHLSAGLFHQNSIMDFSGRSHQGKLCAPYGGVALRRPASDQVEISAQGRQTVDRTIQAHMRKALFAAYEKPTPEERAQETYGLTLSRLKSIAQELQAMGESALLYQGEIDEFRDNLGLFDSEIGKYQGMLDGTETIPDGLSREAIQDFLLRARQARETYADRAGKQLEERSSLYAHRIRDGLAAASLTDWDEAYRTMGGGDFYFHADADDLYGEMGRVTDLLDDLREQIDEVLKQVYKELDERGVSDIGCRRVLFSRENQKNGMLHFSLTPPERSRDLVQEMLSGIKKVER